MGNFNKQNHTESSHPNEGVCSNQIYVAQTKGTKIMKKKPLK
jgi:hypothetical protein